MNEMKYLFKTGLLFFTLAGAVGCKTYYISVKSFKDQFEGIDSSSLKIVSTRGPAGYVVDYSANPIEYIECVDKEGNPYQLKNSPSIEMRITENDRKRTIFYFDKVYLQDTMLIGDRSRFFGLTKSIPINNIKLIEVQDGHKNFKYVEKKKK